MTIAGQSNFPSGEGSHYSLTVTLKYQAPSSSLLLDIPPLPPITIKEDGSPICTGASLTRTYRLFHYSSQNDVPVKANWFEFELDGSPKPVTAGNGFSTLHLGESITRKVTIAPECFDTEPGKKYELRMPNAYGWIEWWGVGEIEGFREIKVRATECSSDGALNCGSSNDIEVVTEV